MPEKLIVIFLTRLFFQFYGFLNVTVRWIARINFFCQKSIHNPLFYLSIFFNFTQVSVLEKTEKQNILALSLKKENVSCTFHIETTVLIFVLYILIMCEIIWLYFFRKMQILHHYDNKKLVLKTYLSVCDLWYISENIIFVLFTKLKTVWVFVWFSIFV